MPTSESHSFTLITPPGKGTLGASYLNLMPSLANILARLQKEGYTIDGAVPDEATLKELMLLSGRNVGDYAKVNWIVSSKADA